ncbi:cytochrome b5-like heme/steroid binding domain-containing protein [Gaertneriomyces semiglobifer]|nr:cytochrome b5-like heme/steroid binding domain-containing protein [Gaertneriomyces semiglobifer]
MPQTYTVADLATHKSETSAWVAVHGKIYDVTSFLNDHPGGKKVLLKNCGKDATKQFDSFHNDSVLKKYGEKLYIGELAPEAKL